MSNKPNFKAAKARQASLNKALMIDVHEAAMKHDGENFSLLAVGRVAGLKDVDIFEKFSEFIEVTVKDNDDWVASNYEDHMALSNPKLERTYYVRPIGVPDAKMTDGFNYWDFHINKHLKEDYTNFIKK